jgi:hypothetical protein
LIEVPTPINLGALLINIKSKSVQNVELLKMTAGEAHSAILFSILKSNPIFPDETETLLLTFGNNQ